jgi:hypothetical protein
MPTLGMAMILKYGASTVSVMVVVAVRLPEVPLIVRVRTPPVTELLAVRVSVLVPVVVVGEKDAVTPVGNPVADSRTLPLNPNWGTTRIVEVAVLLGAMLTGLGVAVKRNVGV